MEPTNQEKTKFRQTKAWKEFREKMLKRSGMRCELLGVKLTAKTAHVHHLHPEEYFELREDWFKVLSPTAHELVEHIATIRKDTFPNREKMEAWLGEFLPVKERTVDKYYEDLKKSVK